MKFIRFVLFPLSLIYGLIVILRNKAYDYQWFKSQRFNIPLISIGNLVAGGSGKSTMAEYLVSLFKNDYKVATLSRGYGRKTKGFLEVKSNSISTEVGDEPLQFKQKFRDVTIAVCENRVKGIKRLNTDHDLIILDDAYQHRAVIPGLSILLFDYNTLFKPQLLLPTGDLREPFSGRKRTDIIVVTKAPLTLNDQQREKIVKKISPYPHQSVFISSLNYGCLHSAFNENELLPLTTLTTQTQVLLLTGIANAKPLLEELQKYTKNIDHHNFSDHYNFTPKDINEIVSIFGKIAREDKLIITTEKDVQRLRSPDIKELFQEIPVYYIPVEAVIHEPGKEQFNELIKKYVKEHSANK
ncbi:MAG: tetraacyldisaccharide 4'-kinase [Daejeonella sp.]